MAISTSASKSADIAKPDLRSIFASQQSTCVSRLPVMAQESVAVEDEPVVEAPALQNQIRAQALTGTEVKPKRRVRVKARSQKPAPQNRHTGVDEMASVVATLPNPLAGMQRFIESKQFTVVGMLMAYIGFMILGRILQSTVAPALMGMAGLDIAVNGGAFFSRGTLGLLLEPFFGAAMISLLFLLPNSLYAPHGRRKGFAALVLASIYAMAGFLAVETLGTAVWVMTGDSFLLFVFNIMAFAASLGIAGYLLQKGLGYSWQSVIILVLAVQIASDAQMALLVWTGLIPVDSVQSVITGF